MKVNSTNAVSITFRVDPLTKAKMDWINAQYPEFTCSGSMMIRRALSYYQSYLETLLPDPELLRLEGYQLKAAATGEGIPWRTQPDFTKKPGKPISEYLKETGQRRINKLLTTDPDWRLRQ